MGGLIMEGGKIDLKTHLLVEQVDRSPYQDLNLIQLVPQKQKNEPGIFYECPLYKTLNRGDIPQNSTHGTNFIIYLKLQTDDDSQGKWIIKGVAMFCQSSD